MAGVTSRLGLTKPAGNEPRSNVPLNSNFDKIDKASGLYIVTNGSEVAAEDRYDGMMVRERTSYKTYELRKNGAGVYEKKWIQFPYVYKGFTLTNIGASLNYTPMGFNTFIPQGSYNSSQTDIDGSQGNAFVVPCTGIWHVKFRCMFWGPNTDGHRGLTLYSNGAAQAQDHEIIRQPISSFNTILSINLHEKFDAGERIRCAIYQSSANGNMQVRPQITAALTQPLN